MKYLVTVYAYDEELEVNNEFIDLEQARASYEKIKLVKGQYLKELASLKNDFDFTTIKAERL